MLLLDKADIYLYKRLFDYNHNSLVSVFLHRLEYYQGIIFLSTNRLKDFDKAIQSRIYLKVKYNNLCLDTREILWRSFLTKAGRTAEELSCSTEQLLELAERTINSREVGLYTLEKLPTSVLINYNFSRSKIL